MFQIGVKETGGRPFRAKDVAATCDALCGVHTRSCADEARSSVQRFRATMKLGGGI